MDTVDKLKILTEELPPVPKLSALVSQNDEITPYIEYAVEKGTAIGFAILYKDEISGQEAFMSKGTLFPFHIHDALEILIPYEGKLLVRKGDEEIEVNVGDTITFKQGESHCVTALEDTWMVGITIPSSDGYPK